jgi:hypothetical protein
MAFAGEERGGAPATEGTTFLKVFSANLMTDKYAVKNAENFRTNDEKTQKWPISTTSQTEMKENIGDIRKQRLRARSTMYQYRQEISGANILCFQEVGDPLEIDIAVERQFQGVFARVGSAQKVEPNDKFAGLIKKGESSLPKTLPGRHPDDINTKSDPDDPIGVDYKPDWSLVYVRKAIFDPASWRQLTFPSDVRSANEFKPLCVVSFDPLNLLVAGVHLAHKTKLKPKFNYDIMMSIMDFLEMDRETTTDLRWMMIGDMNIPTNYLIDNWKNGLGELCEMYRWERRNPPSMHAFEPNNPQNVDQTLDHVLCSKKGKIDIIECDILPYNIEDDPDNPEDLLRILTENGEENDRLRADFISDHNPILADLAVGGVAIEGGFSPEE